MSTPILVAPSRPTLPGALAGAALLATGLLLTLAAVSLVFDRQLAVGRFDAAFLALLGLALVPLRLLDGALPGGSVRGDLAAAGAVGVAAAALAVMAVAQVTYLHAWLGGDLPGAMTAAGGEVGRLWSGLAEARVVLVAAAIPHAVLALARRRGLGPVTTALAGMAATSAAGALALQGFVGLPQVSWLHGLPWLASPTHTLLMLQPIALPPLLAAAGAVMGRVDARRAAERAAPSPGAA